MCVWVQRKWKKKYSEQKYKRKKRDDILNLSQSQILFHVARSWGTQRELHLVQWITQAVAICRCTDCYFFSFSLSRHLEKNKIKISTQKKDPLSFPSPKPPPLSVLKLSTLNSPLPSWSHLPKIWICKD